MLNAVDQESILSQLQLKKIVASATGQLYYSRLLPSALQTFLAPVRGGIVISVGCGRLKPCLTRIKIKAR